MTARTVTVILSASILNAAHIDDQEEEPEKNYPQVGFLARRQARL